MSLVSRGWSLWSLSACVTLGIVALALFSTGASAATVDVIDGFEDGDTDEYEVHVSKGEDVGFEAATDRVFDGDFAGKFPNPSGQTSILAISMPGDGLSTYPSAGDSFVVQTHRDGSAGRSKIVFGVQDVDNYYQVLMEDDGRPSPEVHLIRVEGGEGTRLDSGGSGIPDDSWEQVQVQWGENGQIRVDFTFTSYTLEAKDTTFTGGGFGYGHQVGTYPRGAAWFDQAPLSLDPFEGSTSIASPPPCASLTGGCPAGTLGYTDTSTGGGTAPSSLTVEIGDMDGHEGVNCLVSACSFWLDLDADVSGEALVIEDGQVLDIASVYTVDDGDTREAGTITAVARVDETQTPSTWLEDIEAPEIPQSAFPANGPLELRIEPLDSGGDPWSVDVNAAQVELIAPPAVIVHGWDPNPLKGEYGDQTPAWEQKLADAMRSRALDRFGQDPWSWAGADGFKTFSYDNKKDFRAAAQEDLRPVVQQAKGDVAYNGGVDLLAKSMGGLVSRYLVQEESGVELGPGGPDRQGLGQQHLVRKLVTLGTPHHGSWKADVYTKGLDVGTKHATSDHSLFGPSDPGHGFYIGNDGDEVGIYDGTEWQGWRAWWNPSIEANRYFDDKSVLADFELKRPTRNVVLQFLNAEEEIPGVEPFYLAARQTYREDPLSFWTYVFPETLNSDWVVPVDSATRGDDTPACSDVVDVETGFFEAVHTFITEVEPIRDRAFSFLAGIGPSACDGGLTASTSAVPDGLPQAPSLREQTKVLTPTDGSSTTSPTASGPTLHFTWNVTSASTALFKAEGLNDSLEGLDAQLTAPNGTTLSPSSPDEQWFMWNQASDPDFGDILWVVVDEPVEGEWRLKLSGQADEPRVFVGTSEVDSLLRLERRFDDRAHVGQSLPIRVAFSNGSTPQLGAQVEGQILDPTLNRTTQIDLRDDGVAPDRQAGDGVYAASYRPLTPGHHPFTIEARSQGDERVLDGSLPVVVDDRFVARSCLQLELGLEGSPVPSPANVPSVEGLLSCLKSQVEQTRSDVEDMLVPLPVR